MQTSEMTDTQTVIWPFQNQHYIHCTLNILNKCTQIYLSGHNGHNEREVPQYDVLKVWQFWCIFLPPISPSLLLNKKCSGSLFSCFLLSSIRSFTVCWAFGEDSVSRRLTVCVYLCVYTKVRQGVYPRWQTLFVFFFPTVCVFCYLEKVCMDTSVQRALVAEVWRSLSSLSLHHTHLS